MSLDGTDAITLMFLKKDLKSTKNHLLTCAYHQPRPLSLQKLPKHKKDLATRYEDNFSLVFLLFCTFYWG